MATLLLGALLACGAKETGHTATSAMPYCEETEDALGWDDASPGGGSTPAEAQAFVAAEIERWSKVVRDAGLKAD